MNQGNLMEAPLALLSKIECTNEMFNLSQNKLPRHQDSKWNKYLHTPNKDIQLTFNTELSLAIKNILMKLVLSCQAASIALFLNNILIQHYNDTTFEFEEPHLVAENWKSDINHLQGLNWEAAWASLGVPDNDNNSWSFKLLSPCVFFQCHQDLS